MMVYGVFQVIYLSKSLILFGLGVLGGWLIAMQGFFS